MTFGECSIEHDEDSRWVKLNLGNGIYVEMSTTRAFVLLSNLRRALDSVEKK